MLFGLQIRVGPRKHMLGQGVDLPRRGQFWGCFPHWAALYNTAYIPTKHALGLVNIQVYLVSRHTVAFTRNWHLEQWLGINKVWHHLHLHPRIYILNGLHPHNTHSDVQTHSIWHHLNKRAISECNAHNSPVYITVARESTNVHWQLHGLKGDIVCARLHRLLSQFFDLLFEIVTKVSQHQWHFGHFW